MAIKLMSGDGELEAWAAHGVAAAARARRVISGIRDARARASEALENQQQLGMDGFSMNTNDVFYEGGNRKRFSMDMENSNIDDRAGLLMKRAELRSRRKKARMRIAALEAEKEMADERARLAAEHIEREKQLEREAAEAEVAAAAEKSLSAAQAATAAIAAKKRAEEEEARRLAEERELSEKKAADELRRKEEEERKSAQQNSSVPPPTASATHRSAAREGELSEEVTRIIEGYDALLEEGTSFGTSTQGDVKRARTILKKAINKAGNQIAGSQKQVTRCIALIVDALNKSISGAAPLGAHAWCCTTAAKRLLLAAENVTGGAMRFAIAFVIVGIITNAPDKQRMELAMRGALISECKAIIPRFARKQKDESVENYRRNIGARPGENLEKLSNRWANMVGLYAACCQSNVNSNSSGGGGFSIDEAWVWLAKICNAKQQHAAVPVLVVAFLETAGYEMSRRFGRQFAKLLAQVQKKVLKGASKNAPPGPNVNLEEIITEFVRNECRFMREPEGKSLKAQDAVNRLE